MAALHTTVRASWMMRRGKKESGGHLESRSWCKSRRLEGQRLVGGQVGKGGGLKNIARCLPNGRTGNGMSKDRR